MIQKKQGKFNKKNKTKFCYVSIDNYLIDDVGLTEIVKNIRILTVGQLRDSKQTEEVMNNEQKKDARCMIKDTR